jgi:redox-sensitive bicupin YhaK (pirin superfamily)
MSGPITAADTGVDASAHEGPPTAVEITDSRETVVGEFRVRRALPRRARRTVGPWCFVDHMGPATIAPERGLGVAPHPHIGLQTVTWLIEGEGLHRDSLGSEQVIAPGQCNLMTAGHGVAHSEEGTGYRGSVEGVQLWVAQPDATRNGAPAFEHHTDLPRVELPRALASVIVGEFAGLRSPARRDTDHVGIEFDLTRGPTSLPLRNDYEHAILPLTGTVNIDRANVVEPGRLAYLGVGRSECELEAGGATRVLLIGGVPLDDELVMWWNFVGRSREEIVRAHADWSQRTDRFGNVRSSLPPTDVSPPPWAGPQS